MRFLQVLKGRHRHRAPLGNVHEWSESVDMGL
jgi:hypothetical protein